MRKVVDICVSLSLLASGSIAALLGMLLFVTMQQPVDPKILAEMIPVMGYCWLIAFAALSRLFWRMKSWKWATALLTGAMLLMCFITGHPIPAVAVIVFGIVLPGPAFIAGVLAAGASMSLVVTTRFGMFYHEAQRSSLAT